MKNLTVLPIFKLILNRYLDFLIEKVGISTFLYFTKKQQNKISSGWMNNPNNLSESNMYANYDEEFSNILSQYPILEPYLTLDFTSSSSKNQKTLEKVQQFYEQNCLNKEPHLTIYSEDIIYFYSSDNLKLHMVYFLSLEIWEQANRIYKKYVSLLSSIIFFSSFFLDKYKVNKIKIEYQRLFEMLSRIRSNNIESIRCKLQDIKSQSHLTQNFDPNNRKIFLKLITFFTQIEPTYIDLHCYQHIFEASISSKHFVYSHEIKALIDNFSKMQSSHINRAIYNMAKAISDNFDINKPNEIHIIYILLIRYIYDQNYDFIYSHYFISKENLFQINKSFSNFQSLQIPQQYLPANFIVKRSLKTDCNYRKAISFIESINYLTNPFDVLLNVHKSLTEIQEAAKRLSKQPNLIVQFDDKVILLFLVIFSSQIPELMSFVQLVNDYQFDKQLNPELDELKTILTASIDYISPLITDKS